MHATPSGRQRSHPNLIDDDGQLVLGFGVIGVQETFPQLQPAWRAAMEGAALAAHLPCPSLAVAWFPGAWPVRHA